MNIMQSLIMGFESTSAVLSLFPLGTPLLHICIFSRHCQQANFTAQLGRLVVENIAQRRVKQMNLRNNNKKSIVFGASHGTSTRHLVKLIISQKKKKKNHAIFVFVEY